MVVAGDIHRDGWMSLFSTTVRRVDSWDNQLVYFTIITGSVGYLAHTPPGEALIGNPNSKRAKAVVKFPNQRKVRVLLLPAVGKGDTRNGFGPTILPLSAYLGH